MVLRSLFEKARQSVILAGYSFDHAEDVRSPLYAAMRDHGVSAAFFVDIPQIERPADADAHVARAFKRFLGESWPFGEPCPRLFFDKRALKPAPPWCSIHAKCVVVDGASAFVSSANFTQRGQERNIEVGVLIEGALPDTRRVSGNGPVSGTRRYRLPAVTGYRIAAVIGYRRTR